MFKGKKVCRKKAEERLITRIETLYSHKRALEHRLAADRFSGDKLSQQSVNDLTDVDIYIIDKIKILESLK